MFTAAHHQPSGPYMGRHLVGGTQPSPCNNSAIPYLHEGVILVSHGDLDTLGGVLRATAPQFFTGDTASFWDLAEFVDTRGAHKLALAGASSEDVARLYAWWAWYEENRLGRMSEVTDITPWVQEGFGHLMKVLRDEPGVIAAGEAFRKEEEALNRASFLEASDTTALRVSGKFVNHLYVLPNGARRLAVVAYNNEVGDVTVSLADPVPALSCRDFVQALWGPEAGGHTGIAGSPRGVRLSVREAIRALDLLTVRLA